MVESDTLWAYVLSGGSPLAIEEIYRSEKLEETFISLISDWILGDIAQSGRSRLFLLNLLRQLYRSAPNPLSYTKLAKDAGLANNTAALDYVERLSDLLCVLPMMQWDPGRKSTLARKPSKFPFINLGVAWAFHPRAPRYLHELKNLQGLERGAMMEWVVAQELWRRTRLAEQRAISVARSPLSPSTLMYWASKEHEIDFVLPDGAMYEVKSGQATPQEFHWFHRTFPGGRLNIVCDTPFETKELRALKLEQFLLEAESDLYFDADRMPWEQPR
jgi:predicted AAA+ superfamily ATPase